MIFLNNVKKANLENLLEISKMINHYEHFIFYGTLLGITRENGILANDDDIDFLINIDFKKNVIRTISNLKNFTVNKKVSNEYFVQFINSKEKFKTFIDFYFYVNDKNKDYIIEKHNFFSSINDENKFIYVPKKLIFPVVESKLFPKVKLPNKREELCKFLYGHDWKKPMRKNSSYRMEIINNKPKLIKRSFLGSLTRMIKEIFVKKFKKS